MRHKSSLILRILDLNDMKIIYGTTIRIRRNVYKIEILDVKHILYDM